jgi:hypothetical protein
MAHRLYSPEVKAFQEAQLARLKTLSYSELRALPRSTRVPSPEGVRGIEFWVERREGDGGGVRIEARACRRHLLIFMSCNCPGFEMLPDGSLAVEVYEPPED